MSPARGFNGTLRPLITYLGRKMAPIRNIDRKLLEGMGQHLIGDEIEVVKDHFNIKWIEGDDVTKVIWEEEAVCLPGISFIPQIVGEGNFQPTGSMYVDKENLRHRVMNCESGVFGSKFHRPTMTEPIIVKQE